MITFRSIPTSSLVDPPQTSFSADQTIPLPNLEAFIYVIDPSEADRKTICRSLQCPTRSVIQMASVHGLMTCGDASICNCAVIDEREWRRVDGNCDRLFNGMPLIIVSSAPTIDGAIVAIRNGASDYVAKPIDPSRLRRAVDAALAMGESERADRARRAEVRAKINSLSGREREVMRLVVEGLANKQVAGKLDLSEKTVEVYRSRVMKKLGVRGLADLVRMAILAEQMDAKQALIIALNSATLRSLRPTRWG